MTWENEGNKLEDCRRREHNENDLAERWQKEQITKLNKQHNEERVGGKNKKDKEQQQQQGRRKSQNTKAEIEKKGISIKKNTAK